MNMPGNAATPSSPIRVALVDDQTLVRSGFRMLIDSQADLEVVAEVASGREAVASPAVARADVILMDIRMPEMDGIQATSTILAAPRKETAPKVLILTTFDLDEYALDAVRAGASGFLLKDAPPEELLGAIRTVFDGGGVVAPSTTRRLLDHMAPLLRQAAPEPTDAMNRLAQLTAREREVFELIATGLTNGEIASTLFLSEATVKTHVGRILAKLEARDRVQAVLIAYETGVVTP